MENKKGFQKNHIPWNKGKKHTEETRKKISKTLKGHIPWNKNKKDSQIAWNKGTKGICKSNKGTWKKGKISWNKGLKGYMKGHKPYYVKYGKEHHNWQGGKSFEPYSTDWTRELRIAIRERDKYTCQLCGEKQGDRAYSVHHIDYNKLNCNSDNLITLCRKCHQKTNFKRNYWLNYFRNEK